MIHFFYVAACRHIPVTFFFFVLLFPMYNVVRPISSLRSSHSNHSVLSPLRLLRVPDIAQANFHDVLWQ